MSLSMLNAAIARLSYMVNGNIGVDWRTRMPFILHTKDNGYDAVCEAVSALQDAREQLAIQAKELAEARAERDEAIGKWEAADGMDGSVVHAIREVLYAGEVPVAPFIDDHVANAIVQRNQERAQREAAEKEVERKDAALRKAWEAGRASYCPAFVLEDAVRTEREWAKAYAMLAALGERP